MLNQITIHDITFDCIIGDLDWERTKEQTLRCDVTLTCDFTNVAASDNLHDTIDYVAIAQTLIERARSKKFHMLEALVHDLATYLLKQFSAHSIQLTLRKTAHFSDASAVSVSGTWERTQHM